ncbi:hypothetical protein MRX96_040630 [Rhipicephalus microplus]
MPAQLPEMLGHAFLVCVLTALLAVPHRCDENITCTTDADCTDNMKCIAHHNYGKESHCETHKYCIAVNETTCICRGEYKCRVMDCHNSPFECLILDNLETRCGGSKAPKCTLNEYCAYGFVARSCSKCPCYGSHQATCVRKQYNNLCSPDSIVRLGQGDGLHLRQLHHRPPRFLPE